MKVQYLNYLRDTVLHTTPVAQGRQEWACVYCGDVNLSNDASCCGCGASAPDSAYWRVVNQVKRMVQDNPEMMAYFLKGIEG